MQTMLFQAHSGLRYLVLAAAVVALVFVVGQRYAGGLERARRISTTAFVGILDLQVLLGIVLLFTRPFYGQLIGHIVMMVLALVTAHLYSAKLKRTTDPGQAFSIGLLGVVLTLVFVVGGIMAIGRSVV